VLELQYQVIIECFIGADINAQTEETQETALTLACCGGFLDVADFLIKAGADNELGTSISYRLSTALELQYHTDYQLC
jgi:ankyrin repeat protein